MQKVIDLIAPALIFPTTRFIPALISIGVAVASFAVDILAKKKFWC